ncbi:hypothetical protein PBY51_000607 [Eleginops maclovinus]|uniref:Uncharacterized protein n=1 Tax=Eleginops maclovinus TaxID=56733 RepID=A0AAN7XNB7_ELEMC|nr:hypothetical protein PBY51_000607 [Eleginops maclovinus]
MKLRSSDRSGSSFICPSASSTPEGKTKLDDPSKGETLKPEASSSLFHSPSPESLLKDTDFSFFWDFQLL